MTLRVRCDICERDDVTAVNLTDVAVCWHCQSVLDALQDLWDVLPEPKATRMGAATGSLLRRIIELGVSNAP